MANWTAEVTSKSRNPTNFNIVVERTYADSDTKTSFSEQSQYLDADDAFIAEETRKRIRALERGDAALAAITLGPVSLPPDPVQNPVSELETKVANLRAEKTKLDALQWAVDNGKLPTDDPDVVAAGVVATGV